MPSQRTDLRIFCWEGYDNASVLDPFRFRHDINVETESLISDSLAAQHVSAPSLETEFDVLNINNAWVQKYLYPNGLVRPLDKNRFEYEEARTIPTLAHLDRWSWSADGQNKIGVCQRFGSFNLVVNSDKISHDLAVDEGFHLADDPDLYQRYGILLYDDFNVFHICIAAEVNPFNLLSQDEEDRFEQTARRWFRNAAIATHDHHALNRALIDNRIDFYLSGGTYTASPARLDGNYQVTAITPARGPINGRGGIVFTEVTCVLDHAHTSPWAEPFLDYMLEPDTCVKIAFADRTCNPVLQMGDREVMSAFSSLQLQAIQWDTLEEDISRCVDYDLVPNSVSLLRRLEKVRQDLAPR